MNSAPDNPAHAAPTGDLLSRFAAIVGEKNALRSEEDIAPYLVEERGLYHGRTAMVLRPGSTEEVSQILALANETATAIVPQGGNTGLVGGQVPHASGNEIILSLSRLNQIRAIDTDTNAMTVEAGCVLADIQNAAEEAGRLFPLSLGSEGSCQIGGNISSNAGGIAVLAYGNTRELVLGLEVVLADGRIWDGLRALRKDNTGYDLKQLFIGAEGTLGIITAAVLKLFPLPAARDTAFVGMASPEEAGRLFRRAQGLFGNGLTSFELLPRIGMEFCLRHVSGTRDPLQESHPWYVLMEVSSGIDDGSGREKLEQLLARAIEDEVAGDAVITASTAQSAELWKLRHAIVESQKYEGGSIKHDVAVPVSKVPEFIEAAAKRVVEIVPGARPVPFGHFGDGNIHFNITQPEGADAKAFLDRWEEVSGAVLELVAGYGGTISAEHGIGQMKRHLLPGVKSPVEMELMRMMKRTLDPKSILNPGKTL